MARLELHVSGVHVGVGVLLRDFRRHDCKRSSTASDTDWTLLGMRISWGESEDGELMSIIESAHITTSTYLHTFGVALPLRISLKTMCTLRGKIV